jgi:signal transduction histidine kinase
LGNLVEQAFHVLSECPLFCHLTARQKETLFARVRICDFADGECIFLKGLPGHNMMVVIQGNVRLSVASPNGRQHVLGVLSAGDVFGEIAVLDGKERTAEAMAATACTLAILERRDLLTFLDCNPSAWQNIVSVLCERLRRTDRHIAEIGLLSDKNWQLAEASQHKSRFLAAASHDLRQPLHALELFVGQLPHHMRSTEGRVLADRIDTAVATMSELFNDLLDISRLDAGVLNPTITEFPIAPLLEKIENTFATAAHLKGIAFRLRKCSAWVRSDPILLERIVLNLVSNAVRYTVSGRVIVGCRRREGTIRVEVWDSGPGIPEIQRQKIFNEFYRLPNSGGGGLGLGLAIVERLCTLLQHPIDLISTLGKGSRFSVTVPVSEAKPQSRRAQPSPTTLDVLRGKLVIVIDDDPLVLSGMGGLLDSWGCHVLTVGTPEAALKVLSTGAKPDLIISDYNLDNAKTGIDAINRIRAAFGSIPAFLISADTLPERRSEAHECGYHLLFKPVRPVALRALMSQLLVNGRDPHAGSKKSSD